MRGSLRGMDIIGYTKDGFKGIHLQNYDKDGYACSAKNAKAYGSSVCDDVILIPINIGIELQFLQIAQHGRLTLCEVQAFAGKHVVPF